MDSKGKVNETIEPIEYGKEVASKAWRQEWLRDHRTASKYWERAKNCGDDKKAIKQASKINKNYLYKIV